MVFSHLNNNDDISIKMRGTDISRTRNTKFLGVIIDDELKFKEQTECVAKKMSRGTGIMFRMSPFVPRFILSILYYSLVYPYVSYCLLVWGNSSIGNVNKVNQIHKIATRLMQARYNNENSLSKPILSVPKLFTFSTILKFYKYVGSHKTSYLGNKIAELSPVHSHFARFANDSMFNTPAYNKAQSKKKSFSKAFKPGTCYLKR